MEPRLALPSAMNGYGFKVIAYELCDLWRSIDVRNEFQIDLELPNSPRHMVQPVVEASMLVRHRAHGDALFVIVKRARQSILGHAQTWNAVFLGEAPNLASGRNRRLVIEIHLD